MRGVGPCCCTGALGNAQGLGRLSRLVGQDDRPAGGRDPEAFTLVLERLRRQLDDGDPLLPVPCGEDAELVAAHAVGAAEGLSRRFELHGQAAEKRVAGGMTERVVVALEAVEIEEDEQGRCLGVQSVLEIREQLPPVGEPGERVGLGLRPATPEEPCVLAEGERHPADHRGDGERCEDQGGLVQPVVVVVDEQAQGQQTEADRHDEEAKAFEPPMDHGRVGCHAAIANNSRPAGHPASRIVLWTYVP